MLKLGLKFGTGLILGLDLGLKLGLKFGTGLNLGLDLGLKLSPGA